MAPRDGTLLNERRTAVEIAESIKSCSDLIRVADLQIRRARTDLGVARVRLAELEAELTNCGIAPADEGEGGR